MTRSSEVDEDARRLLGAGLLLGSLSMPTDYDQLRRELEHGYLARGNFARVYAVRADAGVVLKVTRDRGQAEMARLAMRDQPRGIVPVRAAMSLRDGEFAIVEQRAEPLADLIDGGDRRAEAAQEAMRVVGNDFDLLAADGLLTPDTIAPEQRRRPRSSVRAYEWDLRHGLAWIVAKSVTPADAADIDLHWRNVGLAEDEFVIIDLGQGRAATRPWN